MKDTYWQDAMADSDLPKMIDLCEQWLLLCAHPAVVPCVARSYTMKHWVEKWAGEYIIEPAFICAALSLGYTCKWPQYVDVRRGNYSRAVWYMRFGRFTQPLYHATLQYTGIKGMPIL